MVMESPDNEEPVRKTSGPSNAADTLGHSGRTLAVPTMTPRPFLARMLEQRCLFVFLALLALLVTMPFVVDSLLGRALVGLLNLLILVTTVAAVGRSRLSFLVAVALGLPTLVFQLLALASGLPGYLTLSWSFGAAFYAYAIAHLLHYVLRRDNMTADKLYGAVAVYLMIAIFWAYLFGVLQYFHPGAFALYGAPATLNLADLIFYSFTVLTTAGFGDITPVLIQSRFPTILEAVTGVMFVAILIARLTGVYPVVGPKP
ncbi:potassium channel family protein [Azotobacter beijerinckii]|uniref:Ion channel n=1 Tax=Azotobacter beijerinckii TaxID=170623 RepID=A0A1I4DVZ4_9GAMM|nr:potassium channel family protein [Azotobacter beijerinckii]SFB43534.1 Ion channel [Azotobacter beijerinckii]SFK97764.1 Ion channel [Azotobacter beijerinckii]